MIVLATAAPAAAQSTDTGLGLKFTNAWAQFRSNDATGIRESIECQFEVEVTATGDSKGHVTSITVVVSTDGTALATKGDGSPEPATIVQGTHWKTAGTASKGGVFSYTFLWTGDVPAYQSTDILKFRIPGKGNELVGVSSKTLNATATSPSARSASTSGTAK